MFMSEHFAVKWSNTNGKTSLKYVGYVCNTGSLNREQDAAIAISMGTLSV